MNKVILVGRLGADAEVRAMADGSAVAKFNLATSEQWKDKGTGEKKEKTEWHRCNLWGDRATKLAQYLTKGKQLLVEGQIQYGSYEKDGIKHYTTDIRVFNVEFVGGKSEAAAATTTTGDDWDANDPV